MYDKIPISKMSHEEWLALRKTGLGGSDAGAVCGLNPYSSPMKVFRDKTTEETEEPDSEATKVCGGTFYGGHRAESKEVQFHVPEQGSSIYDSGCGPPGSG